MTISPKCCAALLLAFLALTLMGCKPETPPQRTLQTGALVSPRATATQPASPLPTPIATLGPTFTPYPTPWPRDFTPSPQPTLSPTPEGIPYMITDTVNHFSVTLPPGWYAYTPDAHAIAGGTDIANYDISHIERRPANGLIVQISGGPLPSGQTFVQWLANYRAQETSTDNGAFGVTLSTPQPYKLGHYDAVAYTATGQGESVLVLVVPSGDGWFVTIGLSPYDASNPPPPSLTEALSMLSTIQISSQPLR